MGRRISRRRSRKKARKLAEETEDFVADVEEDGLKDAIQKKAESVIEEAIEDASTRALKQMKRRGLSGRLAGPLVSSMHDAIHRSLAEPPISRYMTSDKEAWFEREIQAQKDEDWGILKEIWDLKDIESEKIINDELSEIDQLGEKDLEETVEELEEEIPQGDEIETDESEEDTGEDEENPEPKKCYSVSFGFGDWKVTFNSCDGGEVESVEEIKKKVREGEDITGDLDDLIPPSDNKGGWYCPVYFAISMREHRANPIDGGIGGEPRTKNIYSPGGLYRVKLFPGGNRIVISETSSYVLGPTELYPDWTGSILQGEVISIIYSKPLDVHIYGGECIHLSDEYPNNFPINRKRIPETVIERKKNKKKKKYTEYNIEYNMEKECCLATLSLVRKIANVTGVSEKPKFPGTLPAELTDANTKDIIINDIADWHQYHFDMVDELVGQFPIDFKIEGEDANPGNISEALAEIYGMTLDVKVDVYENKMAIARTMYETGLTRLAVNRILKNLEFVIEHLDPERDETEEMIDMTFNPLAYEDKDKDGDIDEDSIEDFLEPSQQPIKYYVPVSKKQKTLKEVISLLTEAAQITKALHWHKMPRDPIAAKGYLKDLINLGTDVAADFAQYKGDKGDKGDKGKSWEDFMENIEENWKDKTGVVTDDKSDNPKIKEIK